MTKLRIFAWKLGKDILPTKQKKFIRSIETDAQCNLCGCAMEDSFHATVECPQARNLRFAIADPQGKSCPGKLIRNWLLLLLDRCAQEQGDLILLVLWRAWTIHNNATNGSGSISITDSVYFLLNFRNSLSQVDNRRHWMRRVRLSAGRLCPRPLGCKTLGKNGNGHL